MKKIAMVIGILSVLATSANAGYWTHTPNIFGGGLLVLILLLIIFLMGGWFYLLII